MLEPFRSVASSTLGHFRTEGFMDVAVQSLVHPVHVVGRALTVSTQPTDNGPLADALEQAQAGDVLVVDRQGDRRHACWGGVLTTVAQRSGVAAVVVDGPVTDRREIVEAGFPTFCRSVSALTTRRLDLPGSIGAPIVCGGIAVRTGDIVVADDDGVVVLPAEEAEVILAEALRREAREARMRALLDEGATLTEARKLLIE